MAENITFAPAYTSGQAIVTGASASVTLANESKSLVLTNTGAITVHVRVSEEAVTATAADYPVLPLSQVSISKAQDHTIITTYSAAAGALHVMAGEGF